jgi:hypothetical protein
MFVFTTAERICSTEERDMILSVDWAICEDRAQLMFALKLHGGGSTSAISCLA